jgi:tetratricopeptide (TPR) repeat protein
MAYGKAINLLNNKDYDAALLNISTSLYSEYLGKHPEFESRFLRKLAEAYVGLDNYFEVKKAILRAIEIYNIDSDFRDYFSLGFADYKLGNKEESIINLKMFIALAETFIKSSNDDRICEEHKRSIEMANRLINKLG